MLVARARSSSAKVLLGLSFGRFGEEIHSVTLRLSKIAEVNGAPSTRCEITVGLKPKRVRVEHTAADLTSALERAADKALRSVTRALEQERNDGGLKPPRELSPTPRRRP